MVFLLRAFGSCVVLRPYIHTLTTMPKILYAIDKMKSTLEGRVISVDDRAVLKAEKADKVNE